MGMPRRVSAAEREVVDFWTVRGHSNDSSAAVVGKACSKKPIPYAVGVEKAWWVHAKQALLQQSYLCALLLATDLGKPIKHLASSRYYSCLLNGVTYKSQAKRRKGGDGFDFGGEHPEPSLTPMPKRRAPAAGFARKRSFSDEALSEKEDGSWASEVGDVEAASQITRRRPNRCLLRRPRRRTWLGAWGALRGARTEAEPWLVPPDPSRGLWGRFYGTASSSLQCGEPWRGWCPRGWRRCAI